ncbi:thimet oligopeptidase [Trypanosoma cruzi]|nr:thimet oligopeptidase [Trypanosoma cruzi]
MCRNILDERGLLQIGPGNFNPPLAGQQGVAALTSGRGPGGGRGGPLSSVRKGGTARPTQGFLVIRKARAGLSKSGQESHRTCARCRHSGTMFGSKPGTEPSPHRQAPVTRCAPSFSSLKSFHCGRFTAVR